MDDQIFAVLRAYPAIYMACHVEHRSRGQSRSGLTSRDASLLAHVDAEGTAPGAMARHLGIAASTLSAALARLAAQGFLTLARDAADARRRTVRLTDAGRAALAADSVLEPERVAMLLARLDAPDRARAVEGIALLARAARAHARERSVRMLAWLGIALGTVAAPVLVVVLVGYALPAGHVARGSAAIAAPPAQVAALIRTVEEQPRWRRGVTAIEGLTREGDATDYVEVSGGDRIAFRLEEPEAGRRFESVITDPSLPFGGGWTIMLTPADGGTLVAIEERGVVRNPSSASSRRW